MPTYEYECESCSRRFEAVQKMSDAPLSVCPECGRRVHRILSAEIGISFRGSGFYANDSKKAKPSTASRLDADKKDGKLAAETAKSPPACADCPAAKSA
ncbi:MAG: hypothetical protein Pg6C_18910 [Treponemataceae bacterium]|nr:MAG: hypothetical protein Pg6C_18800 [Treponemataceae bacterium]GMO52935.1 MAG: hypothetical protein Pg6C_18910 [Treponemataceae bacterium]